MNVIAWILFGLITGVIVNLVEADSTNEVWVETMILGVLGAVIGGLLFGIVFKTGLNDFSLISIMFALIGSFILLLAGTISQHT